MISGGYVFMTLNVMWIVGYIFMTESAMQVHDIINVNNKDCLSLTSSLRNTNAQLTLYNNFFLAFECIIYVTRFLIFMNIL